MLSLKPRPFVQSSFVLRNACIPTATRASFFFLFFSPFSFFFWKVSLFPSINVPLPFYLYMERVHRTFSPSGWCFPTLWPRAGFFTSSAYYLIIRSINQSNNDRLILLICLKENINASKPSVKLIASTQSGGKYQNVYI